MNNITEELDLPKQAKRMLNYLNLEDSIQLLMSVEDSPRNYCIVTLFLNCVLRLSELTNLNVEQISAKSVTVTGKGNNERLIYLTPAAKNAVNTWLIERNNYNPKNNSLFIINGGVRLTARTIQIIIKNTIEKTELSRDITPQKLRHTAATLLYKYGHVDIRALKEILGHESLNATQIYTYLG
ncbi:MAG: tyrosine-type recombinase/integrase [Defluviitaleaceae bacterium]|nr:tyrosine-type recombinase/integrase [Defluviitaleaceae bacterium]